jgi:hypothetical protein
MSLGSATEKSGRSLPALPPLDDRRFRLEREREEPLFELFEREELLFEREALFELELGDFRDVPDPELPRAIRLSSWATSGHRVLPALLPKDRAFERL